MEMNMKARIAERMGPEKPTFLSTLCHEAPMNSIKYLLCVQREGQRRHLMSTGIMYYVYDSLVSIRGLSALNKTSLVRVN